MIQTLKAIFCNPRLHCTNGCKAPAKVAPRMVMARRYPPAIPFQSPRRTFTTILVSVVLLCLATSPLALHFASHTLIITTRMQ